MVLCVTDKPAVPVRGGRKGCRAQVGNVVHILLVTCCKGTLAGACQADCSGYEQPLWSETWFRILPHHLLALWT